MNDNPTPSKKLSPEALAAIGAEYADGFRGDQRDARNIRRLLDHIEALVGTDPHDPIARQKDDEPRFPIMARDPLSNGIVSLWAALRMRRMDAVPGIVRNLCVTAGKLPYRPDADPEDAMSARQISNAMHLWRIANTPKAPKSVRTVELGVLDDPNDEEVN